MNPPPDRRPAWQREGHEPDYRFSLANERTFLAWVRTALALLAGAVLFDQLATRSPGHPYVSVLAVVGSGIAALLAAAAYWRWRATRSRCAMTGRCRARSRSLCWPCCCSPPQSW